MIKPFVLTDYYKFKRISLKAKSRLDCTASTKSYSEFEVCRAIKATSPTEKRDETTIGSLVLYCNKVPDNFKGNVHRKADMSCTLKGKNLSSVFVPDVGKNLAYGDVKGTDDAMLFVFTDFKMVDGAIQPDGIVEIFIARGQSRNCVALYNLLEDGGLDEEIFSLRGKAQPEK